MKQLSKIMVIFFMLASFALANVPSIHSIYQAAREGDLNRAEYLIKEVLKAYPKSAKAHYVAAWILAEEKKAKEAAHELKIAQQIDPNLSFAKKRDVIALEEKIQALNNSPLQEKSKSSWLLWVILIVAILIILMIISNYKNRYRRNLSNQSGSSTNQNPAGHSGSGGFFGGGFLGSLLSGLALGAGFAAGEKIVDNLTDSDKENSTQAPVDTQNDDTQNISDQSDIDNDFGIEDSSSWDDDSSWDDEVAMNDDFGMDDDSW